MPKKIKLDELPIEDRVNLNIANAGLNETEIKEQRLNVRIGESKYLRLKEIAQEENRKVSDLIRHILSLYIDEYNASHQE